MASIFSKDPAAKAPTVYDRIGPEIKHLQKGASVRDKHAGKKLGAWAASIVLCLWLVLFFMDPFLYSMHKSEAVRVYVYLHNYGSATATQPLVATGIFSADEIRIMNERHGAYQSYFSSPTEAEQQAASTIAFITGLHDLRSGQYAALDRIGKIRYMLFVRMGLIPPTMWSALNPAVE